MTTLKSSTTSSNTVEIEPDSRESDVFLNFSQSLHPFISINRDEFAQAVRDLGFVVIDKADVTVAPTHNPSLWEVNGETLRINTRDEGTDTQKLRDWGDRWYALAAYLEANPHIDPKVEALAGFLRNYGDGGIWESFDTKTSQEVAAALSAHFEIKEN